MAKSMCQSLLPFQETKCPGSRFCVGVGTDAPTCPSHSCDRHHKSISALFLPHPEGALESPVNSGLLEPSRERLIMPAHTLTSCQWPRRLSDPHL